MTILLYILVVVFGFYSFQNLPLALMPSMEVPAAIVYATYPGAGPEDIEQLVAIYHQLEGHTGEHCGNSQLVGAAPIGRTGGGDRVGIGFRHKKYTPFFI